jgi:hypothetical protein
MLNVVTLSIAGPFERPYLLNLTLRVSTSPYQGISYLLISLAYHCLWVDKLSSRLNAVAPKIVRLDTQDELSVYLFFRLSTLLLILAFNQIVIKTEQISSPKIKVNTLRFFEIALSAFQSAKRQAFLLQSNRLLLFPSHEIVSGCFYRKRTCHESAFTSWLSNSDDDSFPKLRRPHP